MDLDGFKQINDATATISATAAGRRRAPAAHGPARERLRARLGGDEFFVVIEECTTCAVDGIAAAPFRAARALRARRRQRAQITASLGVSVFPDDAGDARPS